MLIDVFCMWLAGSPIVKDDLIIIISSILGFWELLEKLHDTW